LRRSKRAFAVIPGKGGASRTAGSVVLIAHELVDFKRVWGSGRISKKGQEPGEAGIIPAGSLELASQ